VAIEDFAFLCQNAFAVALVVQELPIVPASIWILCLSFTVWKVVFPLALVLVSVDIEVFTMSICYVIFKISFIIASIRLDPPTPAFASSVLELALQKVPIIKV
jgi:hypothetical protein